MKRLITKTFNFLFLYPIKIKYCSQSIYRTLLGCLYLWDYTKDKKWKNRADKLCSILIEIQRPDGGFDNGYDYNFGRFHKKGESISPELTGLLVLVEYYKRFPNKDVGTASKKAANWIAENAFRVDEDKWAIPYGPYSCKDIIVNNGISFAASALGVYLSFFYDKNLENVYHGMNKYLYQVLHSKQDQPGRFWYYSDQSRTDLTPFAKAKIDYYHQMQQAESHAIAESSFSSPFQKDIVVSTVDHVAFKQGNNAIIPYYNTQTDIHLWGYSSCASGFIMASKLNKEKSEEYKERAARILNWIIKYSWNNSYFFPIITQDGKIKDKKFYVRSDAWVFSAFAHAISENVIEDTHVSICEKSFCKMESVDFSGIENHATNKRIRFFKMIISNLMTGLWPR
jgi:hypothetical protein